MNARDATLKTLVQISQEQAFSNLAINKFINSNKIDFKDQNLYTTLVYGTLQHLISIDFILKKFITKGYSKLKVQIKWILRIAVFEILFLNRIPDYAIVNEAVNQSKRFNKRNSGLVNGVLRNIIRNKDKIKKEIESNSNLEIRYSIPNWIINKYKQTYGDKTEDILALINKTPDLFIRVSHKDYDRIFEELKEIGAQPLKDPDLDNSALIIKNPEAFKNGIANSNLYKNGLITIQDKGAIEIGLAMNAQKGESILDICAGPGGKTTHLAQQVGEDGFIDALELYSHRAELIRKNRDRLKLNNISIKQKDATILDSELINKYDKVLVDAPCSGLGIIRRKPEIRYNVKESELSELENIQYKILNNAAQYLKEGGILVYSTCTVNPDENEVLIKKFLKHNNNFKLINENQTSFLDNSDGFYYAVLKKD